MNYRLSYTAASLYVKETVSISIIYKKYSDKKALISEVLRLDLLPKNKTASADRMLKEMLIRIQQLTSGQLDLLGDADFATQKQLCFLAVCKAYRFILDFAIEVMRTKYLVFDYQIIESDYKVFFYEKMLSHPELERLSESTAKKLKQVMFRMMEQADLIDAAGTKVIQPQYLHPDLIGVIVQDNPEYLKLFFYTDQQIALIRSAHVQ